MKSYMAFVLLITCFLLHANTSQICLEASRNSANNTIQVCEQALKNQSLSLNERSMVYISVAEYLIRYNRFEEAESQLDTAFNANPEMLKNGIYRLNWLRTKGSIYVVQERYLDALPFYQQALDVATIINNQQLMANSYNDLGAINLSLGRYDKALEWLQLSLNYHRQQNDLYRVALSLANIAEVYMIQGEFEQALDFYQSSISSHQDNIELNSDKQEFYELYLAHVHQDMGNLLIEMNSPQKATDHLQSALLIYQKHELPKQQVKVLAYLAKLYLNQHQSDQALATLNQALSLESESAGTTDTDLLIQLTNALIQTEQFSEANDMALRGLQQAEEKGNKTDQTSLLQALVDIQEKMGNTTTALRYLKAHQIIQKQSLKETFNQSLIKLQNEIKSAEQKHKITQLNAIKKQQALELSSQRWLLLSLFMALLLTTVLWVWALKKKTKTKRATNKDRAIHQQQLTKLAKSVVRFDHLFRSIETPLICFDITGQIIHHSGFNAQSLTKSDFSTIAHQLTDFVIPHLNDEDKLTEDILVQPKQFFPVLKAAYQMWIHQFCYLDDTLVCLFISSNNPGKAYEEAEKIKQYSEYRVALKNHWDYCQQLHLGQPVPQGLLVALKDSGVNLKVNSVSTDKELKSLAVELMQCCLEYWQDTTQLREVELAEKSGLWIVSVDDGRLRTRTLKRYLSTHKMPQHPRWQQVIKTAHFILANCELSPNQRRHLNKLLSSFKQSLKTRNKT